jgi:hypothetical protein
MEHLLAVIGIGALCGLWMVIQIASGRMCSGTCSACEGKGSGACKSGSKDDVAEADDA